jgi:glutamate--cysteine ligase
MREAHGGSYVAFAVAQSARHRDALGRLPFPPEIEAAFARAAEESIAEQKAIEAADRVPFETYRQQYLSQDLLAGAFLKSA